MKTLEQWLDARETGTPGPADPTDAHWERLAGRIAEVLRRNRASDGHPGLARLRAWTRERQAAPDTWQLPGHLAHCPVCLEAFELLLDGIPEVSPEARSRYRELFEQHRPHPTGLMLHWPALAAAAAGLLLIAGVSGWIGYGRSVPVVVAGGRLQNADPAGRSSPSRVPAGVVFTVPEPALALLDNGISVGIDKESSVSFRRSPRETVVDLTRGAVTVAVTPRRFGKRFVVSTPLGDVRVTGTRFRVLCRQEPATEYRNDGQGNVSTRDLDVASVTILVTEGTVRVRNRHESASVTAGCQAILRADGPRIEITPAPAQ